MSHQGCTNGSLATRNEKDKFEKWKEITKVEYQNKDHFFTIARKTWGNDDKQWGDAGTT